MQQKEIREICLKTSTTTLGNPYGYNDKLKISKKRISYKQFNPNTNEIVRHWDYSIDSDEYSKKCDDLCFEIESFINGDRTEMCTLLITDVGHCEIKVTYSDMTFIEFCFDGPFAEHKLERLARAIRNIIPNGEVYSWMLQSEVDVCLNITKVEKLIGLFFEYRDVEWVDPPNGIGYYSYEPWVYDIFHLLDDVHESPSGAEDVMEKEINNLTLGDIKARIDRIGHEERWCPGNIAEFIRTGEILELLERIRKLYYSK